ncbi:DUF4344 domain-containing metallopeptidase [Streptomyces sp. NRRL F-2580]|uniref:DUF4344 domain-containing metallopeptidase n=1 Tax=Streptomyces sp. NRRL F-2580 TaxID=1463841 RepID=UPI00131BF13A|nr:DUF4344 domain-containing metallopeptidase [Streptomyces sp. NRRL F-2580]
MTRRWGTLALCAAALLPVTTGCLSAQPKPAPGPVDGFALRYEQPAAADRAAHRFLRDRAVADPVLADLNAYLTLPYGVAVVARSCSGQGTGYDPAAHRIELCYDDLAEERALFEQAGSPASDDQLADVVRETLYHEAGHALVDALDLPDNGARTEEDAADDFARLMLLRARPEGEETLLTAARAYDLAAAADPEPDPEDEHAPNTTRAESHRCAVHAEAPTRHPTLATPARTPCATTWPHTRDAWLKDLRPLLRA